MVAVSTLWGEDADDAPLTSEETADLVEMALEPISARLLLSVLGIGVLIGWLLRR